MFQRHIICYLHTWDFTAIFRVLYPLNSLSLLFKLPPWSHPYYLFSIKSLSFWYILFLIIWLKTLLGASLVPQTVKYLLAIQETQVQSQSWEETLEKGMDTHSSILPLDCNFQQSMCLIHSFASNVYHDAIARGRC